MHKIITTTKTVVLAVALSFGISFVYAWTAPTQNPPAGNVSAPINTGSVLQQKSGDFTVKNFIADTVTIGGTINSSAITSPKFCIGSSCITAWEDVVGLGGGGSVGVGCGGEGKYLQDIISSNTSTTEPVHGSITKTNVTPSETKTFDAGVKYFVLQGAGNTGYRGNSWATTIFGGGASYAKAGSAWLIVAGGGGGGMTDGGTGGDFGHKNNDGTFSLTLSLGQSGGCPGLIEAGGRKSGGICISGAVNPNNGAGYTSTEGNIFTGGKGDAGNGGGGVAIPGSYSNGGGGGYGGGDSAGGPAIASGGGSYVDSRKGWVCEGGVYFSTADVGNVITVGSSAGGADGFAKLIW